MEVKKLWFYGLLTVIGVWGFLYLKYFPHEIPEVEIKSALSYFSDDPFLGIVRNKADIQQQFEGYSKYGINALTSSRIGYHREIPDTRSNRCPNPEALGISLRCSVVITFHDEAVSTLIRTVTSILQRTSFEYLEEIILVNDFSTKTDMSEIEDYIDSSRANVRIIQTKKREGLIRGRILGAKEAKGDILVFLDGHCEVNTHWVEPLVARIHENRTNVVCPIIDLINPHTFIYSASPIVRGGFNWGLSFTWEEIPDSYRGNPEVNPFKSPTMAGGLFAIDRSYFFELGAYDEGMEIWGGENLEISFKIWMCGGRLEVVPCSRVGHMFRTRSMVTPEENHDLENAVRVAEVWMDDFKTHFYNTRPGAKKYNPDVRSRKKLREKLKCENFDWFLHVVYPEIEIPGKRKGTAWKRTKSSNTDFKFLSQGQIINKGTQLCLGVKDDKNKKSKSLVIQEKCHLGSKKEWLFAENGEIRAKGAGTKLCLDVNLTQKGNEKKVRLMKCHGEKAGQEWLYTKDGGRLYNPSTGMCLYGEQNGFFVLMDICGQNPRDQSWDIAGLTRNL